jgi:protein-disulfide isomerase
MRIVFRHFPLTEVHPHAEIAAESAEFAGAAGLFWEMHDALFANQSRLSIPTIFLIAEELGLPEIAMRMPWRQASTEIECTTTYGQHA